jgi:ribosomal protein L35
MALFRLVARASSARPLLATLVAPVCAFSSAARTGGLLLPRAAAAAAVATVPSSLLSAVPTSISGGSAGVQRRGMTTKTKSAVKKRFRVSGGGLLMRNKAGRRHLNVHKSRSRVNQLGACPLSPTPSRPPPHPHTPCLPFHHHPSPRSRRHEGRRDDQ